MSETKKLAYPLDIQLFAEEGGDGSGAGVQKTDPPAAETTAGIDYSKIEEIINKRSSTASDSAIKGYLKEQGLSGEQLNTAVKEYKTSQLQKAEIEKQKVGNLESENAKLKAEMQNSKLDTHITSKASELGIQVEKVPFVLRLIDRKDLFKEDGTINEEKSAAALEEVLKAFPDFKGESNSTGFKKIGGNKEEGHETEDEEMKKWRKEAGLD